MLKLLYDIATVSYKKFYEYYTNNIYIYVYLQYSIPQNFVSNTVTISDKRFYANYIIKLI